MAPALLLQAVSRGIVRGMEGEGKKGWGKGVGCNTKQCRKAKVGAFCSL